MDMSAQTIPLATTVFAPTAHAYCFPAIALPIFRVALITLAMMKVFASPMRPEPAWSMRIAKMASPA
jgi:hypothetical protein